MSTEGALYKVLQGRSRWDTCPRQEKSPGTKFLGEAESDRKPLQIRYAKSKRFGRIEGQGARWSREPELERCAE